MEETASGGDEKLKCQSECCWQFEGKAGDPVGNGAGI